MAETRNVQRTRSAFRRPKQRGRRAGMSKKGDKFDGMRAKVEIATNLGTV
jgi:hypothetical protein